MSLLSTDAPIRLSGPAGVGTSKVASFTRESYSKASNAACKVIRPNSYHPSVGCSPTANQPITMGNGVHTRAIPAFFDAIRVVADADASRVGSAEPHLGRKRCCRRDRRDRYLGHER